MVRIWSHARTTTLRDQDVVRCLSEVDCRKFIQNSDLSTMMYDFSPWMRITLCHDQAIKWAKAKVHVCSDSALCMKRVHQPSEANTKWKEQIHYFQQSNEYAELCGTDGEPIEFEWNIFQGFTSIEIVRHIQQDLKARRINPDQFEERIIFMRMFNDIDWTEEILTYAPPDARKVSDDANEFQRRHGHSLILEMKKNGQEPATTSHKENGTSNPTTWLMYSDKVVIQSSGA